MGCVASSLEDFKISRMSESERELYFLQKRSNEEISLKQNTDKEEEKGVKKLLLLGAGESGKSTLFKQTRSIYGKGYSEKDRKDWMPVIIANSIEAIKQLLDAVEEFGETWGVEIDKSNLERAERMRETSPSNALLSLKICSDIQELWNDEAIQKAYENREKFQFLESSPYFFNKLDEICAIDEETGEFSYIPSEQDVLRCRVRTTGIVEQTFTIEKNAFKMFDVGGQRNERKKWIHCFEGVTSVIFVAAISEYDQVLFEDKSTNRICEALHLFEEISNSRWFRDASIILFLNKKDLFEEKIVKKALKEVFINDAIANNSTQLFEDYAGEPNSFNDGCEYFKEKFEKLKKLKEGEESGIFTHVTCAMDRDHIFKVLKDVTQTILNFNLMAGGLV